MSTKAPPVRPENTRDQDKEEVRSQDDKLRKETQRPNANAEGRADNIKQNTTRQGHQQDG